MLMTAKKLLIGTFLKFYKINLTRTLSKCHRVLEGHTRGRAEQTYLHHYWKSLTWDVRRQLRDVGIGTFWNSHSVFKQSCEFLRRDLTKGSENPPLPPWSDLPAVPGPYGGLVNVAGLAGGSLVERSETSPGPGLTPLPHGGPELALRALCVC